MSHAYLVCIYVQLNKMNLQMQGRKTRIKFVDALKDLMSKLEYW